MSIKMVESIILFKIIYHIRIKAFPKEDIMITYNLNNLGLVQWMTNDFRSYTVINKCN